LKSVRTRALAVVLLVALVVFSGCTAARDPKPTPTPANERGPVPILSGDGTKTLTHVVSFDGHSIPITLYRPVEATAAAPVPIILQSHGWAGSRATGDGVYRDYHRAGFAVVSIDMRGHGEARSTSVSQLDHLDYEIKDVREVLTYLATLDWVAHESADDVLAGSIGGSYGGAYQLLTAATDPRLDAIAPEITWNDLVQSLAPNGVIKSAWIDLLYSSGNLQARLHPNIHQGFAVAQSQNRIADGSVPGEYDLRSQLRRSSPSSHPGAIRVPTLLIQGVNDTLFNLNQAVANYEAIRATGADVRLVTHLSGHILNTRGTIPVPAPQPVGLQSPTGGSPCGSTRNLTISFYQVQLLGRHVDLGPAVCFALEDQTTITADEYPLKHAEVHTFVLGPAPVTQLLARSGLVLPVFKADAEGAVLAGIPRLKANVTTSGEAILFYSLEAVRGDDVRTLNAQVTPHRITTSGPVSLELGGLGARLGPGERLQLNISNFSDQFGHNGGRTAAMTSLNQIQLDLPLVAKT
jgi:ABC-2 type transport system ATP-binding protein